MVHGAACFRFRSEDVDGPSAGLLGVESADLDAFCVLSNSVSLSEIYCTACSRQIMPDQDSARRHPVLKVLICKVSNSFIFHLIIFDPLFICIYVSVMS